MAPQAISFDAPLQQATSVNVPVAAANPASGVPSSSASSAGVPAGVTFDAPTSQATTVSLSSQANQPKPTQTPQTQPTGAPVGTISATPQPSGTAEHVEQWAEDVKNDLLNGTANTKVGSLLKFLGAPGLASGVSPGVTAFMGSPELGPTRMVQGASELAQSGKRWAGTKNFIGGAGDTLQIPGSIISPEAGELAGAGGEAALTQAERAAKATGSAIASVPSKLRNAFSLQAVQDALAGSHADIQQALETGTKAVQDDWHNSVRGIFDQVAKDAGVTPEKAESLHDVAANVSDAIKTKAQGLYKQADAAVGGTRFQSYQDAVKNIKNAIREEVGLDPERDAQLQQRLADAEAGHDAAKETLAAKGLDSGIIDKADALWKQGSALSDLSRPIQSSISGLRADLQGTGAAVESLSPAKLATRVNALYDKGRLQQALGDGGSDDLLTAIEDTKQRLKDVANSAKVQAQAVKARAVQDAAKVQSNINTAKYAAGAALGSVPGFALLKHMLGL